MAKHATKSPRTFGNAKVSDVFAAYPKTVRPKLIALRQMILDTAARTDGVGPLEEAAARTDGVGPLEEALKWGQPSYLTTESGSGSTIRIDNVKAAAARVAMYFHCQTDLVETFRTLYPTEMEYGGNRSILFDAKAQIPEKALRHCIGLALTYHARKNASKAGPGKTRAPKAPKKPALRRRELPS